jgi:hypothetical protein
MEVESIGLYDEMMAAGALIFSPLAVLLRVSAVVFVPCCLYFSCLGCLSVTATSLACSL